MTQSGPRICHPGGSGLFFPVGGDAEANWPQWLKIVLYMLGLGYSFVGVALVSDIFMGAIEQITSQKKRIFDKKANRARTVMVWNATVANLTLMALGSSAPEILLSVIELFKDNLHFGELGPGTIVGSAAFNLLGISAVCVMAIPSPDVRRIDDLGVYAITAVFSLFAYFWLLVILMWNTEDMVDLEEAIATLVYFPLLVGLAFAADKGWFGIRRNVATSFNVGAENLSPEEIAEMVKQLKDEFGEISQDNVMALIVERAAATKSRAKYRMKASMNRSMTKSANTFELKKKDEDDSAVKLKVEDDFFMPAEADHTIQLVNVEFAKSHHAVLESAGKVVLDVHRTDGLPWLAVTTKYRTKSGTATEGQDFKKGEGVLRFDPGVTEQQIIVELIDDDEWESAESFQVELLDLCIVADARSCPLMLSLANKDGSAEDANQESPEIVTQGPYATATVTIIDDDDPGAIAFDEEFLSVEESKEDHIVNISVSRKQGSKGRVSCMCRTEDASAVAPMDYEALDMELVFEDREMSKTVSVTVKARGRFESTERFRLVLSEPKDGCRLEASPEGTLLNTCWVEVAANPENRDMLESLVSNFNFDKTSLVCSKWKDQVVSACFPAGESWAEAKEEASCFDWVLHVLTLPWKLLFAVIPPPGAMNGWATFFVALCVIGVITAAVGDLAALLGCSLCIPDQITAITFVALGTSLPDTFASKTAAVEDPYADASIGNITGSNSVNVFLGLGISWTIGAVHWNMQGQSEEWMQFYGTYKSRYPDGGFIVKAGSLGFSVAVFLCCAVSCMLLLLVRRKFCGGELGGPFVPKVLSSVFLVILWCAYIAASWLYIPEAIAC